jgi:hypothetical protein
MTNPLRTRRLIFAAFVLGTLLCSAPRANAQAYGMSFSVYSDGTISTDGLTFNIFSSVADNSWGCTHTNYLTTTYVTSPTNRTSSRQLSGLSSNTSISINNEDGTFQMGTSGSFACGCSHLNLGYGGGGGFGIFGFTAIFAKNHYDSLIGKWVYTNSVSNVVVCAGVCQPSTWCSTQQCNWLFIKGKRAVTGAATYCQPIPPFPQCSTLQPTCNQKFGAVIWNPDNECHN